MSKVSVHSIPENVDIIVVGSGVTGMSAAISAATHGKSVVLLEERKHLGGTSAISGGWLWLPGNKQGVAQGDTREDIIAYVKAIAGSSYNEDLVKSFLDSVPEVMDFYEQHTDLEFVYADMAPDYQMDAPGAKESGRAVTITPVDGRTLGKDRLRVENYLYPITVFGYMPEIGKDLATVVKASYEFRAFVYLTYRIMRTWFQTVFFGRSLRRTNGNALITRLLSTAQKLGIPVLNGVKVTELLLDNAQRVSGVVVNGKHKIHANSAVILASGGFSNNTELRKKYFPHDAQGDNHVTPTIGQDGNSIALAEKVGAIVDATPHQPAPWAPVTPITNLRGQKKAFPHLRAFGLPGLISVNENGERFANESFSYHDFSREVLKQNAGSTHFHSYIVADKRAMRRYGIGYAKPFPVPTWYFEKIGYLIKGKTIEDLALKIGVPAENLRATISEFNAGAAKGEDPKFKRGTTKFHHFKGDMSHKPNPNLEPLSKAPYYAVKIVMGDLGTFAGLSVNGKGQVLDAQHQPIDGLYAGGTAAVSVWGGGYPGFGSNLGPGLVQGYLAAKNAATAE
ncbi:MAG: FAD-dependent oxidoreductase [Microbacteriaceae bacterium]